MYRVGRCHVFMLLDRFAKYDNKAKRQVGATGFWSVRIHFGQTGARSVAGFLGHRAMIDGLLVLSTLPG